MKAGVLKVFPVLPIAVLLGGCASSGPPLPPALELPAPVSDLHAVRKGDHVSLSWSVPLQTTEHETVRHYGAMRICRSTDPVMRQCGTPVGSLLPAVPVEKAKSGTKTPVQKVSATYTDTLPPAPGVQPGDEITYAVEVMNASNRSAGLSNRVRVPLFPSIPPPNGFQGRAVAEGVSLSWECAPVLPAVPNVQYRLRVYRALSGSAAAGSRIAEADFAKCPGEPLVDAGIEWEKNYEYRAAVVTVVSAPGSPRIEIEGDDTPAVKVFAHDVFPPAAPSGLQAAYSGVGQQPFIDLVWTPDTGAGLAGYNVYRHEEGGEAVKLNAELVKTSAYRDSAVQSGRRYFYSISAVDERGNKSAQSAEANERVP